MESLRSRIYSWERAVIEKINHGLVIQLGGPGRCRFSFPNYKIKKKSG